MLLRFLDCDRESFNDWDIKMNIPGLYTTPNGEFEFEFTFGGLYLAYTKDSVSINGNSMSGFKEVFDRVGNGSGIAGVWKMRSSGELWSFNSDSTVVQTDIDGSILDSGFYIDDSLSITIMVCRAYYEEIGMEIRMFNFRNGQPNFQVPYTFDFKSLTIDYAEGPYVYTRVV